MSVCICGGMCLSAVQEDICVCFVVPLRNDVPCVCFHSHRLVWIVQIKSFFIPNILVLQKPVLNVWSLNDVWFFGYSFHFCTIKNKTSHSLNTQCFSRLLALYLFSESIDSSEMMISGTQLRLWTYKSHLVFARGSQWEEPLSKGRRKGLKQACCRQHKGR